jgi:8-oxo-dGTP diphosphatase
LGVGAIIFDADKVLLVERAGEPLKGWWSLPGGLVETGETIEDAVRREAFEETGLTVKPLYRFDLFERIMRDAVDYVCEITAGGPHQAAHPGDDASRVAWVEIEHLPGYKITDGTMEAIVRAHREHSERPISKEN